MPEPARMRVMMSVPVTVMRVVSATMMTTVVSAMVTAVMATVVTSVMPTMVAAVMASTMMTSVAAVASCRHGYRQGESGGDRSEHGEVLKQSAHIASLRIFSWPCKR